MDRKLCKEMVHICHMASETMSPLGSPLRRSNPRNETKLQALSIQQPRLKRRLPAADSDSHEPDTTAFFHGDLECTAGSASAALQDSGSPLAADSAIYALLYDDQPWAADSACAALDHGDYDCVAGTASAALLCSESECSNYAAGVDFFGLNDCQSYLHSSVETTCSTRMSSLPIFSAPGPLPHKGVSQQPVYDCAVHRATIRNVAAAILNRANQSRISGLPIVLP